MNIIRGMKNLPELPSGCVLTMGNFDGVHLGHQRLFSQVAQQAHETGLPSVVMLFEPQPLEHFQPDVAPARLTSFREKYRQIKQCGIDYILRIPFNNALASLSADAFITQYLLECLHPKYLFVGKDFTFGKNKAGNPACLAKYAEQGYFNLVVIPNQTQDGYRISSTVIREVLQSNQFDVAETLLGRPYSITGKVEHGNELGRQLGFPTANLPLHRIKAVLSGVFLVDVDDLTTGNRYRGIANIGYRPTVHGKKALLEVNIFDFEQQIYGHELTVTFLKKIREEQKFESLEQLKAQITEDVCIAQKISAKF